MKAKGRQITNDHRGPSGRWIADPTRFRGKFAPTFSFAGNVRTRPFRAWYDTGTERIGGEEPTAAIPRHLRDRYSAKVPQVTSQTVSEKPLAAGRDRRNDRRADGASVDRPESPCGRHAQPRCHASAKSLYLAELARRCFHPNTREIKHQTGGGVARSEPAEPALMERP